MSCYHQLHPSIWAEYQDASHETVRRFLARSMELREQEAAAPPVVTPPVVTPVDLTSVVTPEKDTTFGGLLNRRVSSFFLSSEKCKF